MPISIGDIDLLKNGNVNNIVPSLVQTVSTSKIVDGETLPKVIGSPERRLTILGFFTDNIDGVADYNRLLNLIMSRKVYLFVVSKVDDSDPIYSFVRPYSLTPEAPAGHKINYTLDCYEVPAWGRTYINTGTSVYLLDLDYSKTYRDLLSPLWVKSGWQLDRYTRYFEYGSYVRNDHTSGQDIILEFQIPDNLSKFRAYYGNGSTYTLIGDWGGADAWGATKDFTDPQSVAHDMIVNNTIRGGTASSMTSLLQFGCNKRVLMKITNMSANDAGGADSKTKYGADQLLLRVRVFYSSSEETTWVD